MKKLLLYLFLIPLCFACEKEKDVGEPLMQMHFISFVDESGLNLLESNKIPTSEFHYVWGASKQTWEEIMAEKKQTSDEFLVPMNEGYSHYKEVAALLENDNLLLEHTHGNLERERVISINGVKHYFRYSVKNGFSQNGTPLNFTTDAIDEHEGDTYGVYLHTVVLKDF